MEPFGKSHEYFAPLMIFSHGWCSLKRSHIFDEDLLVPAVGHHSILLFFQPWKRKQDKKEAVRAMKENPYCANYCANVISENFWVGNK